MTLAWILVSVKPGCEKKVVEDLIGEKEVDDAHILFGEYDAIIKIKTDNNQLLQDFIIEKIRNKNGVIQTSTLLASDEV